MAATDDLVKLLETLGEEVPDALLRIVKQSAADDPEALARAFTVMKLAAAGVPEDAPEYVAAVDALDRWTTLMVMRADLQTRGEVKAFIGKLLKALPEVIRIIVTFA